MSNDDSATPARSRLRKWRWLIGPISIYLVICIMLATFQRSLIYLPRRVEAVTPVESGLHDAQVYDVTVAAADGLPLHGWFVPAGGSVCTSGEEYDAHLASGRPVAVVFCGNAGHRGYRGDILALFSVLDVDALIFDYRGYGNNSGSPSEAALISDAQAIWRYLTDARDVAPERIIVFGESLGGGVATQLAAHASRQGETPRALVVQATFSSLVDAASYHYPWLPVRWLLIDRFESTAAMPDVTCPILHVHGTADEIVPFSLGQQLFAAAPAESRTGVPKRFVELPGVGHNNINRAPFSEFGQAVASFLNQISQPPVSVE